MRRMQVCPCLNLRTAPTCSCVFVCVVLSKKNKNDPLKRRTITFLLSFDNKKFTGSA